MPIQEAINRLEYLLTIIPQKLTSITEAEINHKTAPDTWSKKEVIGHLIDSAINNHQRFVKGQFDDAYYVPYNQNLWNSHSYHSSLTTTDIIQYWYYNNAHILHIIRNIPQNIIDKDHTSSENYPSLLYLINDYIVHLEHHLRQIIAY